MIERARVRLLWRRGRALFRNRVARERAYQFRPYQLKTAMRAVLIARAGGHAAIELPTGTGKTLIACLACVLWRILHPGSTVLLIVPSRTLVTQHFEVARWVARKVRIDRLTDSHSGDPGGIRHVVANAQLLVSTPGILAGALRRGTVGAPVIARIGLVIVDEFDQFVVIEEEERQSKARYHRHWQELVDRLPATTPFIVKSATLGLETTAEPGSRNRRASTRSFHIRNALEPARILVPPTCYAPVIPHKPITALTVVSARIAMLLEGIATAKGIAHQMLEEAAGPFDYADVERLAPSLCKGARRTRARIRTPERTTRNLAVDEHLEGFFCLIAARMMMPQFVVEDLTEGLDWRIRTCVIKTRNNESVLVEDAVLLDDRREDGRYRFEAGAKSAALVDLVRDRSVRGLRGVVMVRTITLMAGLRPLLEPVTRTIFELHGEMDDEARAVAIAGLRRTPGAVLLMTRTTGGRGLDLPFADYAVLFSPKSEPAQTWQEMSRIRSTRARPKEILILCYEGGPEPAMLANTVESLRAAGREVSLEWVHDGARSSAARRTGEGSAGLGTGTGKT